MKAGCCRKKQRRSNTDGTGRGTEDTEKKSKSSRSKSQREKQRAEGRTQNAERRRQKEDRGKEKRLRRASWTMRAECWRGLRRGPRRRARTLMDWATSLACCAKPRSRPTRSFPALALAR